MGVTNSKQAHDFYYKGVNDGARKQYRGCSLWYEGKVAYSYSTVIAKVIPGSGYNEKDVYTANPSSGLTLVTFDSMTSSTSKHRGLIVSSSPFKVICVPFRYGHRWDPSPATMVEWMLHDLETYSKLISKAEYRSNFACLMDARQEIVDRAAEEWSKAFNAKAFDKYKRLYATMDSYVKELKSKKRAEAAKQAAETRKILAKWLSDKRTSKDYLDLMRTVFSHDSSLCRENQGMTTNERSALRRRLGIKSEFAYVWVEDDHICTSKNISVDIAIAKVAMKAWALGHDMRGFKVDMFSIVKYEGDTIQIGCHKIPRENMLALYEVVMGEPFPRKEQAA